MTKSNEETEKEELLMQSQSPVSVGIDNIRIGLKANDWEDAIRQASEPLVGLGAILGGYVDSMVNSVKELSPYIVLMPLKAGPDMMYL